MEKDQNQHSLKEVLKEMINRYRLKEGLQQVRIKEYWTKEMGPAINKYTSRVELRKRTLYISIDSASLKQELDMGKEKIKQLLNQHLGEDYIESVVIL